MKSFVMSGVLLAFSAAFAPSVQADVFAASATNKCLANNGGQATMQSCSVSRHNNDIPYKAGENVFYGPLKQAGQCLDIQNNKVLFANCNGSKSQTWKLSGSGQLNNEQPGLCVNASLAAGRCPQTGTWFNLTYKMVKVPTLSSSVTAGTVLAMRGNDLINKSSGQIVAGGAGNIVAAGAGNIVAGGAGNIVAAGAGNIVVSTHPNIAGIVAGGAGN